MKILIISQYFFPETFKVNDIAFDFVKRGHEVTVLTGKPNYPNGNFYEGYGFFKKRKEVLNDVNIIRVPLFPRLDGSGKYLALNYMSFIFFSIYAVLFRVKGEYDVIFSHLPSPLTSAIPGIWLKKKFKAPLILWVLDLWPESVSANSKFKEGSVLNALKRITKYIYKKSDKILVSSQAFEKSIIENFEIKRNKIEYFPNWAEDIFTKEFEKQTSKSHKLPDGFNVMFAGNIGESQDFEAVLEAASLTQKDNINWILVGDGRKSSWIKDQLQNQKINNVYLLGRFPLETMPQWFEQADAMLVSLKDEPTFSLTVPAKVQAYMASGKVILGMLNGEGKNLINDSGSGFAVSAGDSVALAQKCRVLSNFSKSDIAKMEQVSFSFYKEKYSKEILFNKLDKIFHEQTQ